MMSVLAMTFSAWSLLVAANEPVAESDLSPRAAAIDEFLDRGFNRRQFSKDEIRDVYREVSRDFETGPELDYAYALVLLHRNEFRDAMSLLEDLRELRQPAFAPAWQVSIWQLFLRRQYDDAFEQLNDLIELTSKAPQGWQSPEQAEANALWVGTITQALTYQLTSKKQTRNLQNTIERANELFEGPALAAFNRGTEQTEQEHRKMSDELGQKSSQAKEEQEESKLKAAEIASQQSAKAEETREKLQLTAQEWKSKVEKGLSDLDPKIQEAQKNFQTLNFQRQAIEKQMAAVAKEKARLDFLAANPNLLEQSNIRPVDIIKERNRIAAQYQQFQLQRQKILASLNQVAQQGLSLLTTRQKLIQDYQKATGKLIQQDKELEKLTKKLADSQQEVNQKGRPVKSTAAIRRLKTQMKRFQTYLTISLEHEGEALVESLNQ